MCTKFPSIKIFFLVKYSNKFTVELSIVQNKLHFHGGRRHIWQFWRENLQVSANSLKLPLLYMFSLPLH